MSMNERSQRPGSLTISTETGDGTVSVALQGELDLASAPQLEQQLRAIESRRPQRLIVDLAGLAFIDSTGLRLLLQADERCGRSGCELVLRPGDPSVQRVFDVTGALDVLRFEDPPR